MKIKLQLKRSSKLEPWYYYPNLEIRAHTWLFCFSPFWWIFNYFRGDLWNFGPFGLSRL